MPQSQTSANVSMTLPDIATLTNTVLAQALTAVRVANAFSVTITVPWSVVQPTRTTWNWEKLDDAVFYSAYANPFQVRLVLTGPAPSWVTAVDAAPFAAFAGAVAQRYNAPDKRFATKYQTSLNSLTTFLRQVSNLTGLSPQFLASMTVNNIVNAITSPATGTPNPTVNVPNFTEVAAVLGVSSSYLSTQSLERILNAVRPLPQNFVHEFVIWDSPNTAASWGDAPSPVDYVAVLKAAYTAIKSVSPWPSVTFGNLEAVIPVVSRLSPVRQARLNRILAALPAPSEVNPKDFLTAAYAAGAKGYFDAVAYSPLSRATVQKPKPPAPSGDSIKQSDDLRAVMIAKGDASKKIHWTLGYDTDTGKFTTLQQALYLDTLRWFAQTRKDHVAVLAVHTLRDQA